MSESIIEKINDDTFGVAAINMYVETWKQLYTEYKELKALNDGLVDKASALGVELHKVKRLNSVLRANDKSCGEALGANIDLVEQLKQQVKDYEEVLTSIAAFDLDICKFSNTTMINDTVLAREVLKKWIGV